MLAVSGSASTAVRDCAQRLRDALKFVQLASVAKGPRLAMLTTAPLSPALGSHARRQRRRLSRRCMACSVGVVLVDHGSRKAESNDMLVHLVSLYKQHTQRRIVHHAHMELARGRGRLSHLQLFLGSSTHCLPPSLPTPPRRRPALQTRSTRAWVTAPPPWWSAPTSCRREGTGRRTYLGLLPPPQPSTRA